MLVWIKNFFQSSWVIWQKEEAETLTTITLRNPWPVVFGLLTFILYLFVPLTAVVIVLFALLGLIFFMVMGLRNGFPRQSQSKVEICSRTGR